MSSATGSGHDGFSLIELIVVIAIVTVLAGLAMPAMGKQVTRVRLTETRAELAALETAIAAYFEDTWIFPPTFADLTTDDASVSGWSGPYLVPRVSALPSVQADLSKDAWNQDYVVSVVGGSQLRVTSPGADVSSPGDDVSQVIDVTRIRRAHTLDELDRLNRLITAYNARYLPDSPLSPGIGAIIARLQGTGYLPAGVGGLDRDGWGDLYQPDPGGASPVVAVASVNVGG